MQRGQEEHVILRGYRLTTLNLFSSCSPINGSQLEVKTTTPNNVVFKVQGVRDHKTDKITGDLEAKWSDKKNGVALTQSWTTANVLRNHVELDNHIAKGLKLELISTLVPDKQAKNALITSSYKQPGFHTRQHLDLFKVCAARRERSTMLLFCFPLLTRLPLP